MYPSSPLNLVRSVIARIPSVVEGLDRLRQVGIVVGGIENEFAAAARTQRANNINRMHCWIGSAAWIHTWKGEFVKKQL